MMSAGTRFVSWSERPLRSPLPQVRPFRALRFDPASVGDLSLVVAPPYDVIGPDRQRALADRHPANVVRLDLPPIESGDEPDDRYRRAARTLAAWRSSGTLHRDPRPALYLYEQIYRLPGSGVERRQRGLFGRLALEPFGPDGGILPHERTMAGPKEDRYRLLRATAVNTSPVVVLYTDATGRSAEIIASIVGEPVLADVTDDDGVRHRLWAVVDDGDPAGRVGELARLAGAGPITIADGHHRYETALRYRDERRAGASGDEPQPYDDLLVLLLEAGTQELTVLPTHRMVHGLGDHGVAALVEGLPGLFVLRAASGPDEIRAAFSPEGWTAGGGRLGCWTRSGGWILEARPEAFGPYLPRGGETLRGLDVTTLGVALERLAGIDAAAVAAGERLSYSHDAAEVIERVEAGAVDVAFLLEPTPVASVIAVAKVGDVMPQKSTYFYPKALTGLVINPHEW